MREKQDQSRRKPARTSRRRLPCGCYADELATQMGMSKDELLRAVARAARPNEKHTGPVLVTLPLPDVPGTRRGRGAR